MTRRWRRKDDKKLPKSKRPRYWAKSRTLEFEFRDGAIREVTTGLVMSTTTFYHKWDFHRRAFLVRGVDVIVDGVSQERPPALPNWPSVVNTTAIRSNDAYEFDGSGRPTPETALKLHRRANDLLFMLDARRRPEVTDPSQAHSAADWNKLLASIGLGVLELDDDLVPFDESLKQSNIVRPARGAAFVATLPAVLQMPRATFERKLLARLHVVFDHRPEKDPLLRDAAHVLADHRITEEWWLDSRFQILREEAQRNEQSRRLFDLLEDMAVERGILAESTRAHANFRFSFQGEVFLFRIVWPRDKGSEGPRPEYLPTRDRAAAALLLQARWIIMLADVPESRASASLGPHVFGALLFKCGYLLKVPNWASKERWTLARAAQQVGLSTRQVRYAVEKLLTLNIVELGRFCSW